jgi:redox-sensitive bicupin YhaK (pirin superfamily)
VTHEQVAAETVGASAANGQILEQFRSRETSLGALKIWRALPVREKRLIGAWCFLDRYGPVSFTDERAMDVAEHPHIGLQTVSWLFEGEVLHLDSLGFEETVRQGGVNVMTAGHGIAHAELTPAKNSGRLNGVQLWVALPDDRRNADPSFQHLSEVPEIGWRGGTASVFLGSLDGATSPAQRFSEIVGAELRCHAGGEISMPLEPSWEHGLFVVDGEPHVHGRRLDLNTLYYLGTTRAELTIRSVGAARLLLLGGPPFPSPILMWWNFVARTPEEIAHARADWEERQRFDPVKSYSGPRLSAPPLNRIARPNPAS